MSEYKHKEIEKKWQKIWEDNNVYKTKEEKNKEKFYILDMFPYPSGSGLHIGHPKGYAATDIYSRYKNLQGYNVLHPMGWDAFGLPAENYAIKNKIHPEKATLENIEKFKNQLKNIGLSYDWDKEIMTINPDYYKWTQWIFIKLYNSYYDEKLDKARDIKELIKEKFQTEDYYSLSNEDKKYIDSNRLAFESFEPIIWCPSCKTGLANEDLENGKCERCGSETELKPMRQWVLKITKYADRMLEDLKLLDWENMIIEMQKNWIGRSEGSEIDFSIVKDNKNLNKISVFTTRLDTIFGCTYIVISPENKIISEIKEKIENIEEVEEYIKKIKNKSELERTDLNKDKNGVKLEGIYAINPFNNEKIEVFIADYVLNSYGTGSVMAVPAHDFRDFEFAKKYNLPIKQSVVYNIDDYNITNNIFNILYKIKEVLDKESINMWLIGGLACSIYSSVVYRKHEDIDLFVEKNNLKQIKNLLIEKLNFKIQEESDKKIKCVFSDIEVEISIKDIDSNNNFIETKEEDFNDNFIISKRFVKAFKEKQVKTRGYEKDYRDLEFLNGKVITEHGITINSGEFSGLKTKDAIEKMMEFAKNKGFGRKKVNYKLKDWVFSRQRYWGEPIPIIHCPKCGIVSLNKKDLPLKLPNVENYEPSGTGESPLVNIKEWVNVKCPICGEEAKRETNTMPQWAGSCWYYLRYIDPKNEELMVDPEKEKYWMNVDLYVGGAEHATRHLIYARFWHKFLYDLGVVSTKEPFQKLLHVGLVMAEDGTKISKRKGNGIDPNNIVEEFGADSLRLFEMFMGPFSQSASWSQGGVLGMRKFLERVYQLKDKVVEHDVEHKNIEKLANKTIKKVGEDIDNFSFNTAISSLMILSNNMKKEKEISKDLFEKFLIILNPFAPHITEELWSQIGNKNIITRDVNWPTYDKKLIKDDIIKFVISINGKPREIIEMNIDSTQKEVLERAISSAKLKKYIENKEIRKTIFIENKLLNIII
ncbi:leucine--tRNA ligase [Patescibacteria group bacterium]|nr:leucine--tRNA ligase [Patescibacteria group bacterium]